MVKINLAQVLSVAKRCCIYFPNQEIFAPISSVHRNKNNIIELSQFPGGPVLAKGDILRLELVTGNELFPCSGRVVELGKENFALELAEINRFSGEENTTPIFLTCTYSLWGDPNVEQKGMIINLSPKALVVSCRTSANPGQWILFNNISLQSNNNITGTRGRVMRIRSAVDEEDYTDLHVQLHTLSTQNEEAIIQTIFNLRKNQSITN